jgi:hypothetical protein
MIEFLGELLLGRRRYLIEFKLFYENGYYPRRPLRHFYSMSGALSLSIVYFVNLGGIY